LNAVLRGDLDAVMKVFRRNRPLLFNIHGQDGCTPPLLACKHGHLELAKFFFENGALISDRDRDVKRQGNALHYAAWGGHLELVKWLIDDCGASLDAVDIVGNTALLYAVYGGHRHVVDELLSRGRSLQEHNSKNHTALLQAACGGHLELVKWLLEQGFSLDEGDLDGNTSLLFAAWGGHLELIHFLLENGSSLQEENHNGHSIFLSAANGGRVQIVEWLLDQGFSLTETNNNGDTALLLAAYGGHRNLVERLLELGATLDDKNVCGFTPLLSAANGGQLEMAEWLLANGASLSEADYDGYTSLILAACGGNIELVKFFLDKGACIKEKNSNGDTALLLASYCGHRDLVDWLLKNGSSLDEKNDTGMGALISAANGGVVDVVELLLQRISEADALITEVGKNCGDGIESTDEGGYTPLLLAAQRGHLEVVKLLAMYGANVQALTSLHQNNAITLAQDHPTVQQYLMKVWNWRPLQIAAENGHEKRVFALVQAGIDTSRDYYGSEEGSSPLAIAERYRQKVKVDESSACGGQHESGPDVPTDVELNTTEMPLRIAAASREAVWCVLRDAQLLWAPSRHQLFPRKSRDLIKFTMRIIPRVSKNDRIPMLPSEMWMHILSFVTHNRLGRRDASDLEIGWIDSTLGREKGVLSLSSSSSSEFVEDEFLSDDDDDMIDSEGRRARNSTSKMRCRALFPDEDLEQSDDEAVAVFSRDVGVVAFHSSIAGRAR